MIMVVSSDKCTEKRGYKQRAPSIFSEVEASLGGEKPLGKKLRLGRLFYNTPRYIQFARMLEIERITIDNVHKKAVRI